MDLSHPTAVLSASGPPLELLKTIAAGTSASGRSFFEDFARAVSGAVNAPIAFVAELSDDHLRARSIALLIDGELVENVEYSLAGTPCLGVVGRETCRYPSDVVALFPEDAMLVDLGAESYLGVPFFYANGEPAGHMGVLDRVPRGDLDDVEAIMAIFANRATAELENIRSLRRLETSHGELERSNRALSEFASVVAHDLKEPLRIVANFSELLVERYTDKLDADARRYLSFANEGARRANQLVDDLLDYACLKGEERSRGLVTLSSAVQSAVASLGLTDDEVDTEVVVGELPTVLGHEPQLRRLFQNLLTNAVKFRGSGPLEIRVEASKTEQGWHLRVIDNGPGIRPDDLTRIFGVFVRAHSRDFPGTGVGLAICARIAELHGGRIWAESVYGEGAVFHLVLPA